MDKKLYKFGMDWLNGVLPMSNVGVFFNDIAEFSSKLRFERWNPLSSGMYNYNTRWTLDGKAIFQIAWNPISFEYPFQVDMKHNNSGIFISISGDGIRYLHSIGGEQTALCKLLFYLYRNGFKASRFDTYCDILDEENYIVPHILEAFEYVGREQVGKPAISTRLRRNGLAYNKNFSKYTVRDVNDNEFTNITIGNHGSTSGMCRVYNKLVEVSEGRLSDFSSQYFDKYNVDNYWYRIEYEMHKENADVCFKTLMSRCEENNIVLSFEDIFFSTYDKLFKVVVPPTFSYNISDKRIVSDEWNMFSTEILDNTIHLVQFAPPPYVECGVDRVKLYMKRNAAFLKKIDEAYRLMTPSERVEFDKLKASKYASNPRYNSYRDEVYDIEYNSNVRHLVQDFNEIYEQSNCFAIIG